MVSDEPIRQQLLEAEIDQAFHEVFETDPPTPTEDNPPAAVFDEMADGLYQTMLQEQAKEEAAAGFTPIPNQAKALDSSTQGWTNNGNIQYNDSGDTAPSQQESLRQFWDETKNRFSAVKLLFDTQPYGSFRPAFAVADGKGLPDYSSDDTVGYIGIYADKLNNTIKQFATQEKNNTNQSREIISPKDSSPNAGSEFDHLFGEHGTPIRGSKTTGQNGKTERVDIENPAPGKRPGDVHYHEANNTKWRYDANLRKLVDPNTGEFAPPKIQKVMEEKWFQKSIKKALSILGESL